jgi:hypothetical protein
MTTRVYIYFTRSKSARNSLIKSVITYHPKYRRRLRVVAVSSEHEKTTIFLLHNNLNIELFCNIFSSLEKISNRNGHVGAFMGYLFVEGFITKIIFVVLKFRRIVRNRMNFCPLLYTLTIH